MDRGPSGPAEPQAAPRADAAPARRARGRPRGATSRVLAEPASLGRHHFSYLRAALEGVELRRAWSTYLSFAGGPNDERHFVAQLRTLHRRVRRAAEHLGLGDRAQLALAQLPHVAPAPSQQPETPAAPRVPTLQAYIEQRCAEFGIDIDFQSQDDWAHEYRHAYGLDAAPPRLPATALPDPVPGAAPGSAAPLAQRLQALADIEAAVARRPGLADPLERWLSPELAALLRGPPGHGPALLTVANLIDFANVHGHRWWAPVRGLGPHRAARLIAWLRPLAMGLQHPLRDTTLRSARELALTRQTALAAIDPASLQRFGLVPLDRLAVPAELDGRRGIFRLHTPNTFGATTDLEAIRAWLARYAMSPRTHAAYARSVERFYLWCLLVRRKPLSSLVEEDLHAWRAFMSQPPAHWVQARHVERVCEEWRPFRGPLSPLSQRHSFTVIAALLSSLVQAGYLGANAAKGVMPFLKLPRPKINKRRSFNDAQWGWLMHVWAEMYAAAGPLPGEAAPRAGEAPSAPTAAAAIALPGPGRPDQRPARARELRRLRLILELGATTGLRRLEIATARMGKLTQETFDHAPVWMLEVTGKGSRCRRVQVFDDIKALIDQHQRDRAEASMGVDERAPLREFLSPGGGARTDDGPPRDHEPASPQVGDPDDPRPLVGALRPAPPRWGVDRNGVRVLDRTGPRQADRHGALEANALAQSLKRLFARAGAAAPRADPPLDPAAFARASTHWMRHFFANNAAADGVEIDIIRSALGHSDLKTTSVYINPEESALVRGLARMRRRG